MGLRFFYPALTGSKTPTSKFGECEEVRWEITARKPPLIKVLLYYLRNQLSWIMFMDERF
ncbi:hypothetical protein FC700_13415 [Bacillus mycoides]|nr:hypothetical protein FC700_13415 [Bacillus mycoides]